MIYGICVLVGLLIGSLIMFALAKVQARPTEDVTFLDSEKRALEERYADQLREKDEIIAHAKAESNQLASELMSIRHETEARVSSLNNDLLAAIEQRSNFGASDTKVSDLEQAVQQKDVQIARLSNELAEAKNSVSYVDQSRILQMEQAVQQRDQQIIRLTADLVEAKNTASSVDPTRVIHMEQAAQQRDQQIARLTTELNEAKISLAAINQTHEAIQKAKDSEMLRIIAEKEESLNRERSLITNHVQNQLEDQKKQFAETEKALLEKLTAMSDESLKSATEQFIDITNQSLARAAEQAQPEVALKPEAVEDLLQPVREALDRLERQNQLMDRRRDNAFEAIERGIQQLSSEATQLANALRKPATQGAWGETAIITILENAGLIAGENFILQESGTDNKKRTDVVIKLPQDRLLVIDSKAPLEAFWDGMNAPNEEARAMRMKAHARMVRDHVKELGSAYYWSAYDSLPDCVIMFLPTEGAYFAALEADPQLLQEAKEAGVYLANPMTVLNMAHIAAYVLADERVRQNAQEIKNLGSELYERLRMFGEQFTNVGTSLRQSVDNYNKALSWIDRNVMPTARKMQLLGAAKAKPMQAPTHIDKSVKSFQTADLRELPVESTYEDVPESV